MGMIQSLDVRCTKKVMATKRYLTKLSEAVSIIVCMVVVDPLAAVRRSGDWMEVAE